MNEFNVDQQVEVLDEKDIRAHDFGEKARDCRKRIDSVNFDLAEVLYTIHQEALYTRLGYENFVEYVENDLDFEKRKAQYFISMWAYYGVKLAGNPEVMDKVKTIGWTKAKDLIGVVTPDNVDQWVETAKQVSAPKLLELARGALQKMADDPDADVDPADLPTGEKFNSKNFKLTDEQLHNVELALKKAAEMAESDKPGHLIDQICTNFLALNAGVDNLDGLPYLLKSLEENFGITILALKRNSVDVVYGEDAIDAIAAVASNATDEQLLSSSYTDALDYSDSEQSADNDDDY